MERSDGGDSRGRSEACHNIVVGWRQAADYRPGVSPRVQSSIAYYHDFLRGAEGASTIRKSIDTRRVRKLVNPSEKVARRRRKFCRILVSGIYFIK